MTAGGFVLDAFAGPGGWDTGLRLAGYTGYVLGIEHDQAACRTAVAAGHPRVRADVASFPLDHLAGEVEGLIASPPCQAWSNAGKRDGFADQARVYERIAAFANGRTPTKVEWVDERSKLTAEPMRWAVALRPRWIALEQVPPVLELWEYTAVFLRQLGYAVWTGILSAEEYGVPQTRRRAILTARLGGPVRRPAPTHQPYRAGRDFQTAPDLFGDPLPPPVSMAEALGWGLPTCPAWTVIGGGTESGGGVEVFADAGSRAHLRDVVAQARNSGPGAARDPRPVEAPSYTIRAQGSGSHPSGTEWVLRNGNQKNACERRACERRACEPAGTLFFGERTNAVDWVVRNGNQPNAAIRSVDLPAPTVAFGHNAAAIEWVNTRPATTVCGDASRDREGGERQFGEESVRVTVEEAAVLQSFPAGYPWQGTKSAKYRQIGDAVPPLLAAAVLRPLLSAHLAEVAA